MNTVPQKVVSLPDRYARNHPLAIAMWDFSWLERRWPGAGYEDWDRVLDGLAERGYDAVRIDGYPHLVAAGPEREWNLLPPWRYHDWGSPVPITVDRILPQLVEFIGKCAERKILVGLSTWFQNDATHRKGAIASPHAHANIWLEVLRGIERAGLLSEIYYVDFCNEWPIQGWAPFFHDGKQSGDWRTPRSIEWMREAIGIFKEAYPNIPCTFSLTTNLEREYTKGTDVDYLDFLEPHKWIPGLGERLNCGVQVPEVEFYETVVSRAERMYRSDEDYWKARFKAVIGELAEWAADARKPLITTEGWSIIEYKDWPGLDWGWMKEFNAWAVETVVNTGRWCALCTSNFCSPQYRGMWEDVQWHQERTKIIHKGALPALKH
jgi:hypothetical protein